MNRAVHAHEPASGFTVTTHCGWCGSAELEPAVGGVRDWYFEAVGGAFDYDRCAECGSLLLVRQPCGKQLSRIYRGYYTHAVGASGQADDRKLAHVLRRGYVASRYGGAHSPTNRVLAAAYRLTGNRRKEVDVQHRFLPGVPSAVLDYGCGNGAFARRAAALGHRVTAIDFDESALAAARAPGIEVLTVAEDEDADLASRFDHLTAAHVLEHVPDPRAVLSKLRRWAKPGAQLFLEMPNASAAGLATYGRFWRGLEAPRHFSIPSRAALYAALRDSGFTVVRNMARRSPASWMDEAARGVMRKEGEAPPAKRVPGEEEFLTVLAQTK